MALFTETVAAMADEDVARMIAEADQRRRLEQEDAERIDPAKVTAADIDVMKRHELFAFLRKRASGSCRRSTTTRCGPGPGTPWRPPPEP